MKNRLSILITTGIIFFVGYALLFPIVRALLSSDEISLNSIINKENLFDALAVSILFLIILKLKAYMEKKKHN